MILAGTVVKGFWHPLSSQEGLLCDKPAALQQSCCPSAIEGVYAEGDFPQNILITLEGELLSKTIEGKERLYLEKATLAHTSSVERFPWGTALLFLVFFIFAISYLARK